MAQKSSLIIAITFLLFISCSDEKEETKATVVEEEIAPESTVKKKVVFPENWSYLERKFMPIAKLHGKFFQDRIEFHIVKQPNLTLFKSQVEELTFYHIDEELGKKKFLMQTDISSDLMDIYGSFKLKPLDSLTKVTARAGPIILRENAQRFLNEDLTRYELKWEKKDKIIRYQVSTDTSGSRSFTLSEEIPDYSFVFNSVEYGIGKIDTLNIESE